MFIVFDFIKIEQKLWHVVVLTNRHTQTENSEPVTKKRKKNEKMKEREAKMLYYHALHA